MKFNPFQKIRTVYYQVTEGVKNLIRYTPLIWADKNFDQAYMYEMLHFKLERMAKFFNGGNAMTVIAPEKAKEIQEVADLLKKVIDDDYYPIDYDTSEFIGFEKKLQPNGDTWTTLSTNEEHPNYQLWKDQYENAEKQRVADLKRVFDTIGEKSWGWWD